MSDHQIAAIVAAVLLSACRNPSGESVPAWLEDAKKIAMAEAIDLLELAKQRLVTPHDAWTCSKCASAFWVTAGTRTKFCPVCGAAW